MSDEGLTVFGVRFQRIALSDRTRQMVEAFRSDHEDEFDVLDGEDVFECPFLRDAAIVALYDRARIPYMPGYYIVDERGVQHVSGAIRKIIESGSDDFLLSAQSAPYYAALVPERLPLDTDDGVREPRSLAELRSSGVDTKHLLTVTGSPEGFSVQTYFVTTGDQVVRMKYSLLSANKGQITDVSFELSGVTCLPTEAML